MSEDQAGSFRLERAAHAAVVQNALITSLPQTETTRLLAVAKRVILTKDEVGASPLDSREHVYFPVRAVIATVATMRDGATVEVGLIGREGVSGLFPLFGDTAEGMRSAVIVPGSAYRMTVADARACLATCPTLVRHLQTYVVASLAYLTQSAACNGLHTVEHRVARWLLVVGDRAGSRELELTQETISEMLGARRAGVGAAMSAFQHAGLIRYVRGRISILDSDGLERAGCECTGIVRRAYDLLPREPLRHPTSASAH